MSFVLLRGITSVGHDLRLSMWCLRRLLPAFLCVVFLATLASCRRSVESPSPTGVDLVQLFPLAEVYSEIERIQFGAPQNRQLLLEGWGHDNGVTSFAWGMGKRSVLGFYLERPRGLTVLLRGRNFRFEGAPRQTVLIEVNGHEVDQLIYETQVDSDQQIRIPGAFLVEGLNRLVFNYAYSREPKKVVPGSDDYRSFAMQWDTLEFVDLLGFGRPKIDQGGKRPELSLPRKSRVDYFLRIEPGTSLSIENILPWGQARSASLEVTLLGRRGEPPKVFRIEGPFDRGPVLLPLENEVSQVFRLSLKVVSNDSSGAELGGLRLMRPLLENSAPILPENTGSRDTVNQSDQPNHQERPNVVLYIVDTLRADHLGCYGYPGPTSPHIDAFAKESTRFERASAQSAWTKPSVASIISGLYPPVHGANSVSDILSDEVTTLAETLEAAGYATAAFVTNSVLSREYGFDQGYEHFEYLKEPGGREFHQLSDTVNESVFSWLGERPEGKPFFLFVHTMDPHAPYTPRSPFSEKFAGGVQDPIVGLLPNVNALTWRGRGPAKYTARDLKALYDGEIAFNDSQFGALVERLKELNLFDASVVVFLSDHGEEFGDHGRWQHGFSLYQEILHVPLIIKFPNGDGAGAVVERVVGQVDVMPTVLDAVGLVPSAAIQGKSQVASTGNNTAWQESFPRFSFIRKQRWRDVAAVTAGNWKLVWYRNYDVPRPQIELFNLDNDPEERHSLVLKAPILAGYMLSLLKGADLSWQGRTPAEKSVMTDEMEERLRALGYLQ